MKKDTFLGIKKHAIVETTRYAGRWSTKVTFVTSMLRHLSERTVYPDTRKEALALARAFVKPNTHKT